MKAILILCWTLSSSSEVCPSGSARVDSFFDWRPSFACQITYRDRDTKTKCAPYRQNGQRYRCEKLPVMFLSSQDTWWSYRRYFPTRSAE